MTSEWRWLQPGVELRALDEGDTRTITGYAAVYDSWSEPMWNNSREIIRAGAFDGADLSDALCLFNHRYDWVLGSAAAGTLTLASDEIGLRFTVQVPDTSTGRDVYELVRRGDLNECSFGFWIAEDGEAWTELDGTRMREITAIRKVDDVGPVTRAAYRATSVSVRDAFRARLEAAEARERAHLSAIADARRQILEVIR